MKSLKMISWSWVLRCFSVFLFVFIVTLVPGCAKSKESASVPQTSSSEKRLLDALAGQTIDKTSLQALPIKEEKLIDQVTSTLSALQDSISASDQTFATAVKLCRACDVLAYVDVWLQNPGKPLEDVEQLAGACDRQATIERSIVELDASGLAAERIVKAPSRVYGNFEVVQDGAVTFVRVWRPGARETVSPSASPGSNRP
jgi:hypothetical protein